MNSFAVSRWIASGCLFAGTLALGAAPAQCKTNPSREWTQEFHTSECRWANTGRNDYFVLEPGHQDLYDGRDGKTSVRLEITVLEETKLVGGVETRVVEERESHDGRLEEVSRNYFAICGPGSDIFYFGEDVDLYKEGKVVGHEGGWTAGTAGAKPGLFMPGRPLLGARYYQEIAPRVAMDRVEIVSTSEHLKTPAGDFENCLMTEETTPLESGSERKYYAPGVGLIKDGNLPLTKSGSIPAKHP